jgi:hypothetical protein
MEKKQHTHSEMIDVQVKDAYCVITNKEDGFYWVINLEDHPNSFLLDRSYQNFMSDNIINDQESMVIFQPTA